MKSGLWLTGDILNYHVHLLNNYDINKCMHDVTRKKSHVFSTYFMTKLLENDQYDYNRVRRWTMKQGRLVTIHVLQSRLLIVPINTSNVHWVLVLVNVADKKIKYIDAKK